MSTPKTIFPNKKIAAVILARRGSKRLPNKNIMPLDGRPLLSYIIAAIKKSRTANSILVSSDSKKILDVAKKSGTKTSQRPKFLATDKASSVAALKYELKKNNLEDCDYILLCQPTSPLLRPATIRAAVEKIIKNRYDCLFSLTRVQNHPRHYRTIKTDGALSGFLGIGKNLKNRPLYQHNGAIYLYKTAFLLKSKISFPFSKRNSGYILMTPAESVDIDTMEDFELAKYILKGRTKL